MGALQHITAAATRILTSRKGSSGTGKGLGSYHAIAWDLYESVPEVGTYADWISNTLSGALLFAGKRRPDGTVEPAPDGSRAAELVASMAGGIDGQSEMLGAFGTHLAVTGEAWLVILPDPDAESFADDRWVVLSTEEVTVQRGKIKAQVGLDEIEIPEYDPEAVQDSDAPVAIRVWKPSPRRHWESTSPVLRSIVVLEELRLLNAAVSAIARSRITGRGVLLVPAGTRFPSTPGQEQAEDSLLDTFIEVASTAIREPESAAATVPILLEVPGDLISGVKWLQFSSEFDSIAIELRDEAIRRFATGADVPAEMLLGLGDSSHWNAWSITAEALKTGAEPKLSLICQALTTQWLRPLLEAEGDPESGEWLVWYDTSPLRSSSNKGSSALEAFKLGIISGCAARRELGFTEADALCEEDAATSTTEGSEAVDLPTDQTQTMPETGPENTVAAALGGTATILDSFTAGSTAALAAAVDGIVWSALVAAGGKITRTPLCPRPERGAARDLTAGGTVHVKHPVPFEAITSYRLLDDAWVRVPEIAARYGVDAGELTLALSEYTTALLTTGQPHNFDHVTRMLARMRLGA
jgi:hypothetical protein